MKTTELTTDNAESRNPASKGRRMSDRLTTRMVLASGLINLTGAPARVAVLWGMIILAIKVSGSTVLDIVRELKGTETLADIQIKLSAALSVNQSSGAPDWSLLSELLFLWAVGATVVAGVALFYVRRERVLRNQVIKDMGRQIIYLETFIDKSRSSSGLTPTGDTHPKDI